MNDEKNVFVTDDKGILEGGQLDEADRRAMNPAGFVQITTKEQLMALAEAARRTYDVFRASIEQHMTLERAERVRYLRADSYSWRSVASHIHAEWGAIADWEPPSNQLAGMALCEVAAKLMGEDHRAAPWN